MHTQQIHITKRAMALMLTLVYVFGLVKPVMPVVNDLVAHTFYKMEHMARPVYNKPCLQMDTAKSKE